MAKWRGRTVRFGLASGLLAGGVVGVTKGRAALKAWQARRETTAFFKASSATWPPVPPRSERLRSPAAAGEPSPADAEPGGPAA